MITIGSILWLLFIGFFIGHALVCSIAAVRYYRIRHREPVYVYLSWFFCALSLHLVGLVVANAQLPEPHEKAFRIAMISTFTVLALGVWPVVIKFNFPIGEDDVPRKRNRRLRLIVLIRVLACGALGIASIAIIGHVFDIPVLYTLGIQTAAQMAPATAICIISLSFAALITASKLARYIDKEEK